jgi:hypothetical protein
MLWAVIVEIAFGFVLRLFSSYAFILYLGGCRLQKKKNFHQKQKNESCKGQQKMILSSTTGRKRSGRSPRT